jgi:tetratricopeptide (TPR) repeat protein
MKSATRWLGLALACCACAGCGTPSFDPGGRTHRQTAEAPTTAEREEALAWKYNEEGLRASGEGKHRRAAYYFGKAIEAKADVSTFYNNLGRSYYRLSDFDRALRAYRQAEALGPEMATERAALKTNIGDIYRQRKNFAEAVRYYHEALEESPNLARVHYELGNLYLKKRETKQAEYRLNRALAIDPEYSHARLARVILYHLTYRDKKAWEDVQQLERQGFELRRDLKQDILRGMQAAKDRERFQPAH